MDTPMLPQDSPTAPADRRPALRRLARLRRTWRRYLWPLAKWCVRTMMLYFGLLGLVTLVASDAVELKVTALHMTAWGVAVAAWLSFLDHNDER